METEHLRLRLINKEDTESLFECLSQESFASQSGRKRHESLRETISLCNSLSEDNEGYYGIFLKENGRLIGDFNIRYQKTNYIQDTVGVIGYAILEQYRNKGYMTEVLNTVIDNERHKRKCSFIKAEVLYENMVSIHLLEKLNFNHIRTFKSKYVNGIAENKTVLEYVLELNDPIETLHNEIMKVIPYNDQEEKDKSTMLELIKMHDRILFRDDMICHMTASCWIIDESRTKVLLCHHNIYNSWTWLGGHADGIAYLPLVAIKEAWEESSLSNISFVTYDPLSLEILTVSGHEKRGDYIPSHLHLNITYLLQTNSHDRFKANEEENSGLMWFDINDVIKFTSEPWMTDRVYRKLKRKTELLLSKLDS